MCLLAPGVELLLTDAPDVWCVPCGCAGSLAGRVVIALIQAEILDHPLGVGALDHDRVDGSGQELGVVDVGAVDRYPQRAASLLDDYALLGAHLGPVSGVWASRAPLEAALAHHTVGGLPLPADRPQRLTLDDQGGPDLPEHSVSREALKPAVDRRVRTKLARQLVPLHTRAHAVDDPVQHQAQISPRAPRHGRRIVLNEDRLDPLPQLIRQLPDRRQRTGRRSLNSRQGTLLSRDGVPCRFSSSRHNSCPPQSSRIVSKGSWHRKGMVECPRPASPLGTPFQGAARPGAHPGRGRSWHTEGSRGAATRPASRLATPSVAFQYAGIDMVSEASRARSGLV